MYKVKIYFPVYLLITIFFLFSCEKEDDINSADTSTLTEEIQKVETSYKAGDIKLENVNDEGYEKVETFASIALKDRIKSELEESYSKQVTYLKSGSNTVGVFKNGSCGSYKELVVFMDCEDSRPASEEFGWVGSSSVNSNKNVFLKFCVVSNAYFEHTNTDFAVVNLTTNLPWGVSRIARYFDNEDKNNTNHYHTKYDGQTYKGWFGDCWIGDKNTRLSFYYYPKSSYHAFPSLGISYGVLGRFGSNQGYIYSDDEDKGNANWCYLERFTGSGYQNAYSGNIANIMDVGSNTRLYLSKAR